jgi:hypothetical protein
MEKEILKSKIDYLDIEIKKEFCEGCEMEEIKLLQCRRDTLQDILDCLTNS